MTRKSTAALLRSARSTAIERAKRAQADVIEKVQWQKRREFIDGELQKLKLLEDELATPRRVFVSYSKGSGETSFRILKRELEREGFEVATGFDNIRASEGNILRLILTQLRTSSVYVAVLSQEISVMSTDKSVRSAPGVWIMEEKGMALALGMPFVLLVDEAIDEQFWKKTTPLTAHVFFNASNILESIPRVVTMVTERYEELVIERQAAHRWPMEFGETGGAMDE